MNAPDGRAPSRPLFEFEAEAAIRPVREGPRAEYLYANDILAARFEALQAREATKDFTSASNRVAMLIGESFLAAALRYIPEETILLVDINPTMVNHMRRYISALRTAQNPADWQAQMKINEDDLQVGLDVDHPKRARLFDPNHSSAQLGASIRKWELAGQPHPLHDEHAYEEAHRLAGQKALVPWQADISKGMDMRRLADALRRHEATVTFINFSNVFSWLDRLAIKRTGELMERLPVSPAAPIVVTSENKNMYPLEPIEGVAQLRQAF